MDIYTAIAEPNRRRILELLSKNGQMSAKDISANFKMSFPAISQHLKVLKESDLVIVQKDAQRRIYQINPKKVQEVENWAKNLNDLWEARFDRLENLLKKQNVR